MPRSTYTSSVVASTHSHSLNRGDPGPANPDDIHRNIQQWLESVRPKRSCP